MDMPTSTNSWAMALSQIRTTAGPLKFGQSELSSHPSPPGIPTRCPPPARAQPRFDLKKAEEAHRLGVSTLGPRLLIEQRPGGGYPIESM